MYHTIFLKLRFISGGEEEKTWWQSSATTTTSSAWNSFKNSRQPSPPLLMRLSDSAWKRWVKRKVGLALLSCTHQFRHHISKLSSRLHMPGWSCSKCKDFFQKLHLFNAFAGINKFILIFRTAMSKRSAGRIWRRAASKGRGGSTKVDIATTAIAAFPSAPSRRLPSARRTWSNQGRTPCASLLVLMGIISFGRYSARPTEDLCAVCQPTVINVPGTWSPWSHLARSAGTVNLPLDLKVSQM